jgi:copper transport protein
VLALLPVSVSAHAKLIASNPAPGAILDSVPTSIELYFSEPVTPVGRGISVYGPEGRLVNSGSVRVQGTRLSVSLAGGTEGTYSVVWTVISGDAAPSRGTLTFIVGRASPVSAPGLGSTDVGLVSPLGFVLQVLARLLHFMGFALGYGAATYALFVARDVRLLRLSGVGVALLLIAEPLALLAQTASLDPARTFDVDALTDALGWPFGRVFALRVASALLLWAVVGALRQGPWFRWAIPGIGLLVALVDATASHPTPWLPPAGGALTAVHVAAMGLWLGGLAAYVAAPAGGFQRIAAWSVGLLTASGAALALLHIANPVQLVTTAYGVSLLVKVALVAVGLLLAWRARRRWELAAVVGVIAAASVLVSLPPPR